MLRGENVVLGPLRSEDSDKLFNWINDPDTVRYNAPYRPVSIEGHSRWFQTVGSDSSRVLFGIRTAIDDQLIGTVQLVGIHAVHRNAELIIRVGDQLNRGRRLGTEALVLALDFAWRDLNLHRVYLHVFSDNERAIKSYRRVGFQEEGRLREAAFVGGAWRDILIMGILRNMGDGSRHDAPA